MVLDEPYARQPPAQGAPEVGAKSQQYVESRAQVQVRRASRVDELEASRQVVAEHLEIGRCEAPRFPWVRHQVDLAGPGGRKEEVADDVCRERAALAHPVEALLLGGEDILAVIECGGSVVSVGVERKDHRLTPRPGPRLSAAGRGVAQRRGRRGRARLRPAPPRRRTWPRASLWGSTIREGSAGGAGSSAATAARLSSRQG